MNDGRTMSSFTRARRPSKRPPGWLSAAIVLSHASMRSASKSASQERSSSSSASGRALTSLAIFSTVRVITVKYSAPAHGNQAECPLNARPPARQPRPDPARGHTGSSKLQASSHKLKLTENRQAPKVTSFRAESRNLSATANRKLATGNSRPEGAMACADGRETPPALVFSVRSVLPENNDRFPLDLRVRLQRELHGPILDSVM